MSELQNEVTKEGITSLTVEGTVESQGAYTRIRVNAQDEGGGQLLYAIDSDAFEAFSESNEFTVEKGSSHIIYVKDAAGNISSQLYQVSDEQLEMVVNADSNLNTASSGGEIPVIENGGGSTAERVITDHSTDAERLFYTVKTKDEHVFYLVIDQNRENDNVYLLNQVDAEDLYAFTGEEAKKEVPKEDVFSSQLEEQAEPKEEAVTEKKSGGDGILWFLLLALLGGAAFYYYKIYRPKQQKLAETSDAKDLDEFEPEEEEEEILDFTVSKEEKEELMNQILNNNDLDEEISTYQSVEYESTYMVESEEETEEFSEDAPANLAVPDKTAAYGYEEVELTEDDEF